MPLLLDDLCVIREAQRVRCLDIDAVHLTRKLALSNWMLTALVVSSVRRAREIEIALQARGYSGSAGRMYLDTGARGPFECQAHLYRGVSRFDARRCTSGGLAGSVGPVL